MRHQARSPTARTPRLPSSPHPPARTPWRVRRRCTGRALAAPPTAWILALLYTDTDLYVRLPPHRDRRQGKHLVKQQLAAGDQESQPLRDRAQPGGPAGPGQSYQRRRHEGRSLGGRDRPGRLVLDGQLRRRRDVAVLGRRSAVTQHGVDERQPQPPAGRRRRPEEQRVDRQQLRPGERTRPRQRRGLPGRRPVEGVHHQRQRPQPSVRGPDRRLRPGLGHQRRPGRRQAREHAGDPGQQVRRQHHRHRIRLQARGLLAHPKQFLQVAAGPGHRLEEQRLGHQLLQQRGHRDPV